MEIHSTITIKNTRSLFYATTGWHFLSDHMAGTKKESDKIRTL